MEGTWAVIRDWIRNLREALAAVHTLIPFAMATARVYNYMPHDRFRASG